MTVSDPVGTLGMYLHVARPSDAVNLKLRSEIVGTGIFIVQPGVNDLEPLSVGRLEHSGIVQTVLPYVVQESFHETGLM